ncbi:hypothetical protein ACHAWT_009264 [Skeletonema menzelii]
MSATDNTTNTLDLRIPLAEWIRPSQAFGNQQSSGGRGALPDDYLLPALQIAYSLADQICKTKDESGQLQLPTPGTDWIDSIVVITDGAPSPPSASAADGDLSNGIRVEILPTLFFDTTDSNNLGRARNGRILFSLGIVFYELFSGGERPAEMKPKQIIEGDNFEVSQGQTGTRELLESLETLPFGQGDGTIDLEGVDIDDFDLFTSHDLQDEYNDIWGNDEIDVCSLQGQHPRKKESTSIDNIMHAVSVEPLKAKGVPGPLCDLIANMMDIADGKLGGEDGYRAMSDVRDDLQLMLDKPSIYLFDQDMGRLSTTGLQFGGTLFGRNAELYTIIDSYRRSAAGESGSVIISGKSGTGKSLLAVEVGKYVISNGGILLTGKFDQLQQGKPFSALASAFNQFCEALVDNDDLAPMKQKLAHQVDCVLGGDAYQLTKLMPKLSIILGLNFSCSNHDEDCANAQKRLQWLMCKFVQVLSTSFAAPVTLFLDDLQWADSASIAAVNQLLLAGGLTSQEGHFFFLGCYREGDTGSGVTYDKIIPSVNVKLDCMDEETLNTMVSETLCLSPRLTRTLSSVIYHKTKGNPLFVTRLMMSLCKDGLLRPSLRQRRWEWDKEKILCQKLPDDVAEFLSHTIEALPDDLKATLRVLSCFGASVNSAFIKALERALGRNLLNGIGAAVAEGLLDKIDDQYRFSHDRIQEAAYNMMNVFERCEFHFRYGMALASLEDEEGGFIFTAVTQLNFAGPEAVEDERQYTIIANHNLRAGKKAMEVSHFEAAYIYFDNGITFLRKEHWEEHYALSLELFNLAAKCALANGDIISMKLLSQQVLKKAQSFEDTLNVMYCMTCSLSYSSKLPESIETSLDILSQLGIDLRGRESSMEVCVKETRDLLSSYTYDELLNIRRMTDSTMIMAMKFLSKLMTGMAQTTPESAPRVAQQIIQLSLDHGMSPVSPLGFVHFGSYSAKLGDISGGYSYVKLARSLLDKLGFKENAGEIICIGTQVVSYLEPLQATVEYHDEGYAAGMASGDIFQAAMNIMTRYVSSFCAGVKLQTTREIVDEGIEFMRERKIVIFVLELQGFRHSLLKLMGIDEELKHVSAEEEDILATNYNARKVHLFQKSYISFMFRSYDDSKAYAEKYFAFIAKASIANLIVAHSFNAFYIGLISFWVARNSGDGEQWYERGNKFKLALGKWAETSRWTFENKWYLLEAEEAFCKGKFDDAKVYYEKAVKSAKNHKFVHEEALAYELAAYFYLAIGEVSNATEHCLLAHDRYQEWGAIGKCANLFKFIGDIMNGCVDSSPAHSLAVANAMHEVQSDLAHLLSEDSNLNAEARKRRVEDRSSENQSPRDQPRSSIK